MEYGREYSDKKEHINLLTNNERETDSVESHSFTTQCGSYRVSAEFSEKNLGINGEIRDWLKRTYINKKFASLQREDTALQFHTQKEQEVRQKEDRTVQMEDEKRKRE